MFFAPSKSRSRAKIWNICLLKTSNHIQINIRMPKPSQEPPAFSKAPNQDLKDMDVLCTFKIKIESQNSEYGCDKDQNQDRAKIRNMCVPRTIDHIQINIRMPNPSQEPPASSKAPKKDFKDMDVLCTFKTKIKSQNSDYGCIIDQ